MIRFALLLMSLATFSIAPSWAETQPLSAAQQEAIRGLIESHLKEHPELVIDAIRTYQEQQEAAQKQRRRQLLSDVDGELMSSPGSPVIGDPMGDVTLVEFFDYNCSYCKKVFPAVRNLVTEDGHIRYVLKEHPILNDTSVFAARAALGIWNNAQESYFAFHSALMSRKGRLTEAAVLAEAAKLDIKEKSLRAWMAEEKVDTEIGLNRRLARALNITGTPAFIIDKMVFPGALSGEELSQLVDLAREKTRPSP